LLDRQSARVHQPTFLLAGVLLVEVLLFGFLLVVEEETVLVVSGLLEEKGMILLESEILGEKPLLLSGALLVIWYSWNLFSSVDWTGGHRQSYFWSLPMYRCADTIVRNL